MTTQTEHGYLVFADISGYTSFLAKVELDHAHEILADLLEVIVKQFKPMLTVAKLEGDAVFAYIRETQLPRPETLLELLENTYLAFRQRRDSSQRQSTCDCRACQSMPSLDLKFFVHHGDFIIQDIAGSVEVVGSDVNLIHRLSKNHVTETTGWKAYVLFSQDTLEQMHLQLDGLHPQVEEYDHLGAVSTLSLNLHPRYQELVETRKVTIAHEEADFEIEHTFPVPVATLWQVLTDPQTLTQVNQSKVTWRAVSRPQGRTGAGARNHCAHGKGNGTSLTYLDWRPLQYYTAETVDGKMSFLEMDLLDPTADGKSTRFILRLKLHAPFPHWVRKLMGTLMAKPIYTQYIKMLEAFLSQQALN